MVVDLLNEIGRIDPEALALLIETRVPCSAKLAVHPTIQVINTREGYSVGLLGVLNGLFGIEPHSRGCIEVEVEEVPKVVIPIPKITAKLRLEKE
jgi:hypothetical protein